MPVDVSLTCRKSLHLEVTGITATEPFENGIACWQQEFINSDDEWEAISHNAMGAYDGSLVAYFNGYSGSSTRLISPVFNISSLDSPYLRYAHNAPENNGNASKLSVYYRPSANANWTVLRSYTSATSGWELDSVALPAASAEYQIAFVGEYESMTMSVAIDDVRIYSHSGTTPNPDPDPDPENGIYDVEATDGIALTVFPNPCDDNLTVNLKKFSGKVTLEITDMSGRTLVSRQIDTDVEHTESFNIGTFASGIYFVRAKSDARAAVQKLTVK